MHFFLSLHNRRTVTYANRTPYQKGFYHPDRVLKEHDLVYLSHGSWGIGQEGKEYSLHAGDVFFLPAGYHHYGTAPWSPGSENLFVHFLPNALDSQGSSLNVATLPSDASADGIFLPTVIPCRKHPLIQQYFQDLGTGFRSRRLRKDEYLSAKLSLLLCELHEIAWKESDSDPVVDKALELIHSQPETFLSIDDLADQTGVSRRTFTGKFREQTGSTVHQYQTDTKLKAALLQLTYEPQYLLREIAESYGFYDQFHFIRVFKQKYGVTPGEVRGKGLPR